MAADGRFNLLQNKEIIKVAARTLGSVPPFFVLILEGGRASRRTERSKLAHAVSQDEMRTLH